MVCQAKAVLLLTLFLLISVAVVPAVAARSGVAANQQLEVRDVQQGIGSIQGAVTDARNGDPVIGGSVTCSDMTAVTGAAGAYQLSAVLAGTYSVTASGAGFTSLTMDNIVVVSGSATTVDFALHIATGTISGTISDATTKLPIVGATVTCGASTATTSARGEYEFDGVRVGSYTVTASADNHATASALGVSVTTNATTRADLELTATAIGSIGGTVTDAASGAAIQRATVTCGALSAATGADGGYTLTNVPAGTGYRVGASAGGYRWASATGVAVVSGQAATQDFALEQLPLATGAQFAELPPLPGLTNGVDVGWGDYDADGYPDLFLGGEHQGSVEPTRPPHGPLLFHNDQDLTFTDTTASMKIPADAIEQDGVAWGDYNNDGYLDLLVGSGGGYPLLYRRDPTQFVEVGQNAGFYVSFSAGRGTTWCDYNGDNLLDAFCSNIFGPGYLMKNDGDGTFTEVSAAAGLTPCDSAQSASWGDYNNDGWPDLAIARVAKPTLLFRNDGDGTFTNVSDTSGVSAYIDAYGAVWGDYDNDGWLDLYITSGNYIEPQLRQDALFHSNHDGTFTDVSDAVGMAGDAANGIGAAWSDYDNDGYLDIFVGNFGQDAFLYHNNGDGTLTDVSSISGASGNSFAGGVAWADMDVDGRLDLAEAVFDGSTRVFHNISPAGNWLRVRAVTNAIGDATDITEPIRDALGAHVEVNVDNDSNFPAGRTLMRMIDGGSGFCAQNEQVAQFGIPTDGPVAVRVRFPDGSVVIRYGIAVNQTFVVKDVAAALDEDKFTDAGYTLWAYSAIEAVSDSSIAFGYPDGTYHPEREVTRDQMAVFIARAMNGGDPTGPATVAFIDIANPWANAHIAYCVEQGVVQGYDSTHYAPTAVVDRGQLAVFVARAMGWVKIDDDMTTAAQLFPDVLAGFWSGTAIKACLDNGVVQGYDELDGSKSYRPDDRVTRDQMAVFIARAWQLAM